MVPALIVRILLFLVLLIPLSSGSLCVSVCVCCAGEECEGGAICVYRKKKKKKKLVSKGHSDLCSIPKMCVIIQELGVPSFHTH